MTRRFDISKTRLGGVYLLERKPVGDHRGYLERMFCSKDLEHLLDGRHIVQINHSITVAKGTVRGMHFQKSPHTETKIVSCLKGEIFDVAVDLRRHSPTFLHWHAEVISADNFRALFIPEGVAHGFQTLTENCELLYCHTAAFHQPAEGGLNPQDPCLAIAWPLPVSDLSLRDAGHPLIRDISFTGIEL